MAKCSFYDPVTASGYTWHLNYLSCDGPSRPANVSYDSRSSGQGVIPTQGDYTPLVLVLKGTILKRSQYLAFWEYRHKDNSFRFTDEEGQEFEVTMTGFDCAKERTTYNPFDPDMRGHKWSYTMTLQILRVIDGDLEGVPV